MDCVSCGSAAVTERSELTAQGYRRFRCRDCNAQFNERSCGVLNRASLPSDIIAFVVFCRLRYRLTLQDLSEIMLLRGFTVSHECIRQWKAKPLPVMGEALRKRRHRTGRRSGESWSADETYLKVQGRWCYLYRAIDRDGNLIDTMLKHRKQRNLAFGDAQRGRLHGGGHGAHQGNAGQHKPDIALCHHAAIPPATPFRASRLALALNQLG